jgi:hypothetical protein
MRIRYRIAICLALPLLAAVSLAQTQKSSPMTADDRVEVLTRFIEKKKFIAEGLYPGATNERDRVRYEEQVNELARSLARLARGDQTKAVVLGMFRPTMAEFDDADSEEQDRFLGYLEELMDIFGIESSDGLLNKWRYGFDPQESLEVANANALERMTAEERDLLSRFNDVTAGKALDLLRAILGAPTTEMAEVRIWFLKPDGSSAIGLLTESGTTTFTWIAKDRFSYLRRL